MSLIIIFDPFRHLFSSPPLHYLVTLMAPLCSLLLLAATVGCVLALPEIHPIEHASLLLTFANGWHVYSDPVDAKGRGLFAGLPLADVIVLTHSHADHLQPSTVLNLTQSSTVIVAPTDVANALVAAGIPPSQLRVLNNSMHTVIGELVVFAVPMYNTFTPPLHPKGKQEYANKSKKMPTSII